MSIEFIQSFLTQLLLSRFVGPLVDNGISANANYRSSKLREAMEFLNETDQQP